MIMKDDLCMAFCNEISVADVPVGYAVSTAFRRADGDPIEFFIITKNQLPGLYRLEDDGQTIPYLEACGVDFDTQMRAKAFDTLLAEYGAEFDKDEAVIHTPNVPYKEMPRAALRFVALLLRVSDFLLLTQEHIENTFREDAAKRIRETIGDRAGISENLPASDRLGEVVPDMVIRAPNRDPVAVFFGQSIQKVNEAIFLQMAALYEAREALSVVALLEAENSVSRDLRQRAANRLSAVPVYRGDEIAAIQRIEREALGRTVH
jgi:Domain of unknown function DUF1828